MGSFHFAAWVLLRCEERLWELVPPDDWRPVLYSAVELVPQALLVLLVVSPGDLPARFHPEPVGSGCRCLWRVLYDAGARSSSPVPGCLLLNSPVVVDGPLLALHSLSWPALFHLKVLIYLS
ncbi:MAG: hypothetical protein NVS2B12_17160 [Ktedonobacteraceae bacterium]